MKNISIGLGLGVAAFIAAFAADVRPLSAGDPEAKTKVTATDLKCKGCVGKKEMGKNAIKSKNIKAGQVKTTNLGNGAVTIGKLDATAKTTTYTAGHRHDPETALSGTPLLMDQTSVAAPGPGAVLVNFSVSLYVDTAGLAQCYVIGDSITTANTLPCVVASDTDQYLVCSGVQAIPVTTAKNVDLGVYCQEDAGTVLTYISTLAATYTQAGTLATSADANVAATTLPKALPSPK